MTKKTLHNSDISGAEKNVPDINKVGNGDMFQLLCKASSEKEGWMKSTKAMEIPGIGCVVQVTTQQRNPDGSYSVAEAVTTVPGVTIIDDENGGRKLVGWCPSNEDWKSPAIDPDPEDSDGGETQCINHSESYCGHTSGSSTK